MAICLYCKKDINECVNNACLHIRHFTPAEVEKYKAGSLPYPFFIYEGTDKADIIEVNEVASMSGMADNNGTPTEITIYQHTKNNDGEVLTKRLIYKLV